MSKKFICPKCGSKGTWKPYKVIGKGCAYCKPICRYCKKVMKEFLMQHHSKCKPFLEIVEKLRIKELKQ